MPVTVPVSTGTGPGRPGPHTACTDPAFIVEAASVLRLACHTGSGRKSNSSGGTGSSENDLEYWTAGDPDNAGRARELSTTVL